MQLSRPVRFAAEPQSPAAKLRRATKRRQVIGDIALAQTQPPRRPRAKPTLALPSPRLAAVPVPDLIARTGLRPRVQKTNRVPPKCPEHRLRPIVDELIRLPSLDELQRQPRTPLTPLEMRVLHHAHDGCSARETGKRMHRSQRTIEDHRRALLSKFECNSLQELLAKTRRGWSHIKLADIAAWEAKLKAS